MGDIKPIKTFNPCDTCPGREALEDRGVLVRSDFGNAVAEARSHYTRFMLDKIERWGESIARLATANDVGEYAEEIGGCLQRQMSNRCESYYYDGSILVKSELL